MSCDQEYPVAPNNDNTLRVRACPLPLGHAVDASRSRLWTIWIPTNAGGRLTLTHRAQAAFSLLRQGSSGLERVAEAQAGTIAYAVPPDPAVPRRYFVALQDGPAGRLECGFQQKAWSRLDAAIGARALIPWSFWYWPYDHEEELARRKRILKRYQSIINSGVDGAAWEEAHHGSGTLSWEGHCHQGARASVIFREPDMIARIGGEAFKRSDAKFLATEFAGNFMRMSGRWALNSIASAVPEYIIPGSLASNWLFAVFKRLRSMYESAFRSWNAEPGRQAWGDIVEFAGLRYDLARQFDWTDKGGHDAVRNEMDSVMSALSNDDRRAIALRIGQALGPKAAEFYDVLIRCVLRDGLPMIGDLRVDRAARDESSEREFGDEAIYKAMQIWNHGLFCYAAEYVQTPAEQAGAGERDMCVSCRLYANLDELNVHRPLATEERDGARTVDVRPIEENCRVLSCEWRVFFADNGDVDLTRGEWRDVRKRGGTQLFIPRNLEHPVESLASTRVTARRPAEEGNPLVGLELADHLTVHRRFRSGG